jgi:3-deoxy-manno-octulosonate cytidylyltransferase (CMP-KDO synthetase)
MNTKVIIPGRLSSTRLPNKLLADINGIPVLAWVIRAASEAVGAENVFLATENVELAKVADKYGVEHIITGPAKTGTDRIAIANKSIGAEFIVNVQGDEPFVDPTEIFKVFELISKGDVDVLGCYCSTNDRNNKNIPKVVTAPDGRLLYMSRADIPGSKNSVENYALKKQVCIYGFRKAALEDFSSRFEKTPMEKIEDIEILRFLELGYQVDMIEVKDSIVAIDTESDLQQARLYAQP